jgi:hypothetical protein
VAPFLFGVRTENGDEEHRQTKPQEEDILSNTQKVVGNRATWQQIWEYKEILTAGLTQTNNFIRSEKRVAKNIKKGRDLIHSVQTS